MSCHLPLSRIKTIMKSSAEVETISKDSLQLVTIATELFIQHLAEKAANEANGPEIDYKHVAEVVNKSEKYDFLTEIIPRKITVRQYKEMSRKKFATSSDESDNTDSDSSSTGSDTSGHPSSHSGDVEMTEEFEENSTKEA